MSTKSASGKKKKSTSALEIVGKYKQEDDATRAASNYFGEKDSSERESLPAVNVFPVGPSRINCMIILDCRSSPARLNIVNPGADFEEIVSELKGMVADLKAEALQLDYIFITHAHINTFSVANKLLNLGDGSGKIVLHEADKFLWDRWEAQALELGLEQLKHDDIGEPTMLL